MLTWIVTNSIFNTYIYYHRKLVYLNYKAIRELPDVSHIAIYGIHLEASFLFFIYSL
nr:MAG TPA: hypothetical protein [Caudoviricetes sp.]